MKWLLVTSEKAGRNVKTDLHNTEGIKLGTKIGITNLFMFIVIN